MKFFYKTLDVSTVQRQNGTMDLMVLEYEGNSGWEFVGIFGSEALFKKRVLHVVDIKL